MKIDTAQRPNKNQSVPNLNIHNPDRVSLTDQKKKRRKPAELHEPEVILLALCVSLNLIGFKLRKAHKAFHYSMELARGFPSTKHFRDTREWVCGKSFFILFSLLEYFVTRGGGWVASVLFELSNRGVVCFVWFFLSSFFLLCWSICSENCEWHSSICVFQMWWASANGKLLFSSASFFGTAFHSTDNGNKSYVGLVDSGIEQ